ncbi:MAG TPA: glycosyltransferase [Allosphingosinicella sp.]
MTGAPAIPAISVAMSVYNNAPFLAEAIESILAQSFGDFEFLIVNDGSSDGSAEIIDSYAARDSRVRPIHQENRGLVASLNRLIAEARAPLIARMDGDDVSHPERFARQVDFLTRNPAYGVVGAWATSIDERGRVCDSGGLDQPATHEGFLDAMKAKPLMCHPSVMMRTEVVRAAGGYRAAFRHCEDYDLWLRLAEHTQLCSLPERLILYRYSDSQVSEKHVLDQQIGAAIAWLAHVEREAGRPDPFDEADSLPPLESLDSLFGRPGIARAVREIVAPRLLYSPVALGGPGYDLILSHARDGAREGMWKTAARLVRFGRPGRALRLAAALATP